MLCPSQICDEIGVKSPINVKMFTGKSKLLLFFLFIFLNLYNEKVERLLPMNAATDLSEILRKRRKHLDFVGDVFYV